MKVFTAEQIRQWDKFTIASEPISSLALMERAASKCTHWIRKNHTQEKTVIVICGPGNNGGDGLVVARQLHELFYRVNSYHINFSNQTSEDFSHNKRRLNTIGVELIEINNKDDLENIKIEDNSIIVDAIFGSGLNRPAKDLALDAIQWINQSGLEVISIDIPSGMFSEDNSGNSKSRIVRADITLSLETCKLSFLLPDCGECTGAIQILPIGLSKNYEDLTYTQYELIGKRDIQALIKARNKYSHKGSYGHAYIVAGAQGKMGAAVLATKACLRTGAGLTTAHVPKSAWEILQETAPEAMLTVSDEENIIAGSLTAANKTIGIGPGIGQERRTADFVFKLISEQSEPMVIDADALNLLSKNTKAQKGIPEGSILTPHPKEFERWVGSWNNEMHKLKLLLELSQSLKVIVVLKGAHTVTATPEGKLYFNNSGNQGMATAGSGDVLTGIITSLLAQGYTPEEAAIVGVWAHGRAGDIAKKQYGEYSLNAGDLVATISHVMQELEQGLELGG